MAVLTATNKHGTNSRGGEQGPPTAGPRRVFPASSCTVYSMHGTCQSPQSEQMCFGPWSADRPCTRCRAPQPWFHNSTHISLTSRLACIQSHLYPGRVEVYLRIVTADITPLSVLLCFTCDAPQHLACPGIVSHHILNLRRSITKQNSFLLFVVPTQNLRCRPENRNTPATTPIIT
ncbi:hypothetical protein BS50DRAFT_240782 [Corynespora cassiicola Philippines]|uniref:Uncharacterized protein n=1 Tax=Corynespora cassiicola Philippines TaxID=1448308 RepID=A0A2T2P2U0_CORCC|nr:hypothetical protein BS50DRAFT_240782 [Corynespora cassiicola Philippines]